MGMYLNFEPDYWYKGAAIAKYHGDSKKGWIIYFEDGMRTYSVLEIYASTLREAKNTISRLIEEL